MENPGFGRLSEELAVVVNVKQCILKEQGHLTTDFPTIYAQILAPSMGNYL